MSAADVGIKLDQGKPRASLVVHGFARALLSVSEVATFGAEKYTANGWVSVPNGLERYTDAMYRHLLADVLGMAASAVVDRFDQLEGALRKACPDLPDEAKTTVQQVIANARNEWLRGTAALVADGLDAMLAGQDEDDTPELFEEDASV